MKRRRRCAAVIFGLLFAFALTAPTICTLADKPPADVPVAPELLPPAVTLPPVWDVQPIAPPEPTEPTESPEPQEPSNCYAGLSISASDRETLACLVYHEARGEPFDGQVAVCEVVLNRLLSPDFPDTVEDVIFQKTGDVWQFSPAPYLWTAKPSAAQYDAVDAALDGTNTILPGDTVYFSRKPYNDTIVAVIANHYFCASEVTR